jgi:hypothetical protein
MGRSGEYRLFAARCLDIARTTNDERTKAAMLQMARVWSRVADEIESSGNGCSADDDDDDAN